MNRIITAIDRMTKQIATRIASGLTTQKKVDALHKTLDMSIGEHAQFQNLKSLAVADGTINVEEGQTLYILLGEAVTVFNNQPIAVKSVLTSFFGELLEKRVA